MSDTLSSSSCLSVGLYDFRFILFFSLSGISVLSLPLLSIVFKEEKEANLRKQKYYEPSSNQIPPNSIVENASNACHLFRVISFAFIRIAGPICETLETVRKHVFKLSLYFGDLLHLNELSFALMLSCR